MGDEIENEAGVSKVARACTDFVICTTVSTLLSLAFDISYHGQT